MIIKILNLQGFMAAYAMRSTDQTRRWLCGVYIEPSGRVTGTNGHAMISVDKCVEPFKGEAFIASFLSIIPKCKRYVSAHIDTTMQRLVVYTHTGPNKACTYDLIDAKYPDCMSVAVPTFKADVTPRPSIGVNPKYLQLINAAFGHNGVVMVFRNDSAIMVYPDTPFANDALCMVMPMRFEENVVAKDKKRAHRYMMLHEKNNEATAELAE
ncbi:hypothetical protein [Mariprofundus ferrooxydans]|uniref:hypothetical protein n=1 Tax=Mariprofundus ferrooxydans TaxID=314344 RepID=UPI001431369A|nr:hypothetical protein [Mariprofundus ferrooxydans]